MSRWNFFLNKAVIIPPSWRLSWSTLYRRLVISGGWSADLSWALGLHALALTSTLHHSRSVCTFEACTAFIANLHASLFTRVHSSLNQLLSCGAEPLCGLPSCHIPGASLWQFISVLKVQSVYLSLCCTRAAAAPRWWGFSLPNSL